MVRMTIDLPHLTRSCRTYQQRLLRWQSWVPYSNPQKRVRFSVFSIVVSVEVRQLRFWRTARFLATQPDRLRDLWERAEYCSPHLASTKSHTRCPKLVMESSPRHCSMCCLTQHRRSTF